MAATATRPRLHAVGFFHVRQRRAAQLLRIQSDLDPGVGVLKQLLPPAFSEKHDTVEVRHLVLDLHGTLAMDGKIHAVAAYKLSVMQRKGVKIHILTADADGKATELCKEYAEGLRLSIIPGKMPAREKREYVEKLGPGVVYIGNGGNDYLAAAAADVSFGVMGGEGINSLMLAVSDMVFHSVDDAIEAILHPRIFKSGCQC